MGMFFSQMTDYLGESNGAPQDLSPQNPEAVHPKD